MKCFSVPSAGVARLPCLVIAFAAILVLVQLFASPECCVASFSLSPTVSVSRSRSRTISTTPAITTTTTQLFGYDPIEEESPEERANRMELVRKLQQSFYKEDGGVDEDYERDRERNGKDETSSTNPNTVLIKDLPLWRVQWRELPGSQNILNVHVPHYTNMFQKILKGQTKRWGDFDEDLDSNVDSSSNSNTNTNSNNTDVATSIDATDDERTNDNQEQPAHQQQHYFGHVFLQDGSQNLDNPDHALRVGDVGVLMRISDARQLMDDGRLTLVVQALERFRVVNVIRSHSPYAVADVEVVVDREQVVAAAATTSSTTSTITVTTNTIDPKEEAVVRALEWHPFEYRRVSMEECELAKDSEGRVAGFSISPLSNYDATKPKTKTKTTTTAATTTMEENLVAIAERDTWLKLDQLLNLLSIASQGEVGVPVPTQILGLLPQTSCALVPETATSTTTVVGSNSNNNSSSSNNDIDIDIDNGIVGSKTKTAVLVRQPWPDDFFLARAVAKMEASTARANENPTANTLSTGVGTHSKSPFVRVDVDNNNNNEGRNFCYEPLRRAQRLSYVIWTLTESIDLEKASDTNNGQDRYDRKTILTIDSTKERLVLAIEKMDRICALLSQIIRMQGGSRGAN
mmetsp:Transcript_7145/g.14086  ORF Transcript_7145/g.14086 Transcript_7145/m.14086 type:complete len:632 (-) Transcript_7145:767-2662(-)|eukprot:CAMPEP_0168293686 /NCGR_PEP_ID=MMETSP0142_2-20121227/8109_1 /TAXON_ID=44445 /ORGANISM="Pseudo-nitzschia australis, Strain 10249 10 AB" /LENGTH=631 /DNA_ID=CAMNT_0008241839 /DNA_START=93 /DNA_END=1989 /DNA_ORIENTATION=-